MGKALGFDLGSHSAKIVEVEGSARKHRVTRFVSRPVPPGSTPEQVGEVVAELLREARARRDGFVAALGSRTVVMREILVPFREEDQIRRVIRFEAEAHLHNYAIEDVVIDFLKIGEVKEQAKVLIFAAPKQAVRERLTVLQKCGVDPMHIDLDMVALFNAAHASGAFSEHPNAVVLDMGASATNVLFVMNGALRACRAVRQGAEALARALSRDLAVDTDTARAKAQEGDGSPREGDLMVPASDLALEDGPEGEKTLASLTSAVVVDRQDDFVVRIHREVTRTLASWPLEATVTTVFLTGAASLAPGLRERLEERFRKPVVRLRLLPEDSTAVPAADYDVANASIGVALGCALRLLGIEGPLVEFRRDDLRYTRKFDLIKVALASTVSLIFIFLFLLWLHTQNRLRTSNSEFAQVAARLQESYVQPTRDKYREILKDNAKDLGPEPSEPFARLSAWDSQIKKMERHITSEMGFNVQGVPPIRSALAIWRDVFTRLSEPRLRESLGYLWIDEIRVTQKNVGIEGKIGKRDNIDTLVQELNKIDYIEEKIARDTTEVDAEDRTRFGLTADLKPTVAEKGE